MLRSIPWDVWVVAAIAAAVALAAFFGPGPGIFIFICLGLCAYIAIKSLGLNAFSKTLARRASIKGEVATSCSSEADCAAVQGPLTIRVAGVAPRVSAG